MSFSGIIYRSNADGSDVQLPLEELNVSVLILDGMYALTFQAPALSRIRSS